MNLVLDIGNTRIKAALFEGDTMLQQIDSDITTEFLNVLIQDHKPDRAAVSSVRDALPPVITRLSHQFPLMVVDHRSKLPFTTLYETPETLGADRIAALAAVATLHPKEDVLVIDAGTCITYDFIDSHAIHHGGGISPGIEMRFKALNQFTGKLPLVTDVAPAALHGRSTKTSIASGVLNGVLAEVEGIIMQYQVTHSELSVVLTGGDMPFLMANLKTQIFAAPNLVLQGLNSILELNVPSN